MRVSVFSLFFFQAEDGIRYLVRSRGLGDVYKRQEFTLAARRSNPQEKVTIEQSAWLGHIRQVASRHSVGPFDLDALKGVAAEIPKVVREGPSELRQVRGPVSYTHLRAHETVLDLVCRLLLETKNISKHYTPLRLWSSLTDS